MRVQTLQHFSLLFPQQNSTAPSLFLGVTASKTRTFWSIQRTIGKQLVVRPRRSLTMKTHDHIISWHSKTLVYSRWIFHDVLEIRVAALTLSFSQPNRVVKRCIRTMARFLKNSILECRPYQGISSTNPWVTLADLWLSKRYTYNTKVPEPQSSTPAISTKVTCTKQKRSSYNITWPLSLLC